MKKAGWITLIIVIAFGGLIGFRLAGNKKKLDAKKNPPPVMATAIPVNIDTLGEAQIQEQLVKTGTLLPWEEGKIAATVAGTLQSVGFELGTQVSRGHPVALIDNKSLQLKLEAAKLQQAKLKKDLDRYTVLLKGEAATEVNVQDIKYNLDNAENQIAQLQKQMSDNQIKSPVSGQIVEKNVEVGEYVSPGMVLGKVVDISKLKVNVLVAEADAYKLKNGQKIKVSTDLYPGKSFDGSVIFISEQADAAHNYQVQVQIANPKATPLKAGTFVNVDFIRTSHEKGILLRRSALVESTQNPYVYIIEGDKSVKRPITIGREIGDKLEVLDGLKAGDHVVVNGQINLADGSAVKVVR